MPLVHPLTGLPIKMGRTVPTPISKRRMHLPLHRYLNSKVVLPKLPSATQFRVKAAAILSQCGLNDTLSDCTTEAAFHIEGVWDANAGRAFNPTNAQRVAFYSGSTGYAGTPDTDQGGNEIQVLDFWRDHGLLASGAGKIICHFAVDATNPEEVCQAIALGENLYIGMSLPGDWLGKFMPAKNGAIWPIAGDPVSDNGHAFNGVDYTALYSVVGASSEGIIVCTWGILVLIPWNALAKYGVPDAGGEVHVAISERILIASTHKAPGGLDIDQIRADVASVCPPDA